MTKRYILLLLLFWFCFSIIYFIKNDPKLSSGFISHENSIFEITTSQSNKKITAEFKAKENYLGTIYIRFDKVINSNNKINFSLKEKGSDKWYFSSSVEERAIYFLKFYPYGFPIITDSKNKTYIVEISSKGQKLLSIDTHQPTLVSQYFIPKKVLFEDTNVLVNFIKYKLIYTTLYTDFLVNSIFYLLPFLFYLIWIFFLKKFLPKNVQLFFIKYVYEMNHISIKLILSIIAIDVLIFENNYDFLSLLLIISWLIASNIYKLKSSTTFSITLLIVLILPFSLILRLDIVAQKMATWTYYFMIIATFQAFNEENKITDRILKLKFVKYIFAYLKPFIFRINRIVKSFVKVFKKFILLIIYFISSDREWTMKNFWFLLPRIFISIILALIIIIVSLLTINQYRESKYRKSLNPVIEKVEPRLAYKATKIVIYGNNFGWRENGKMRLMSQFGEFDTTLWTNNEIIANIPFTWPHGIVYVRVEKDIPYHDKMIKAQSELGKIELIPSNPNSFSTKDNEFFKQLQYLDKETLKVNGYNRE